MSFLALTPWIFPGVAGALTAGVAILVAGRRRSSPGARELVVLSAAVGWWCLMQVVSVLSPTLEGKVLAAKIQYLGVTATPIAWFWFAATYTSRTARISRGGWLLLAAPQAATLLLAWTNEWHGLVWKRFELVPAEAVFVLRTEYGAWFKLHLLYVYLLTLAGTGMLAVSLSQAAHQQRRLVAAVAAPLVPLLGNLVYLTGVTPPRWVDLTPAGLAIGGVVLAWSLLRDDLLELPPVARARILEAVPDGILVLDHSGRVIDANSAAARLLGVAPGERLGEPFLAAGAAASGPSSPVPAVTEREGRMLEVDRNPTGDVAGGGTVVIVRDVTEQHQLQRHLEQLGKELQRANTELTLLANTDELTGLASRRYFLRLLERERRRASRYQHPFSLLLLDIDRFKEINDALGHAAGDAVLRLVSDVIREGIREVDVAGRLGGDELAVALPETDHEGAEATARRLLSAVEERSRTTPGGATAGVTVSIGLVVAQGGTENVEELLQRADVALYRAKLGGRNQLRWFAEESERPAEGSRRP